MLNQNEVSGSVDSTRCNACPTQSLQSKRSILTSVVLFLLLPANMSQTTEIWSFLLHHIASFPFPHLNFLFVIHLKCEECVCYSGKHIHDLACLEHFILGQKSPSKYIDQNTTIMKKYSKKYWCYHDNINYCWCNETVWRLCYCTRKGKQVLILLHMANSD